MKFSSGPFVIKVTFNDGRYMSLVRPTIEKANKLYNIAARGPKVVKVEVYQQVRVMEKEAK